MTLDEYPFFDTIKKLMYVYGDLKNNSENAVLAMNKLINKLCSKAFSKEIFQKLDCLNKL